MCDVLVLDDDALVLETLVDILREEDFWVVGATNSRDALARFAGSEKPRILVTDVDLGEPTDGRDVAQRARRASPGLPVIFITGRPDRFWGTVLEEHQQLIPKPFRPSELIRAIHQIGASRGRPTGGDPAANGC